MGSTTIIPIGSTIVQLTSTVLLPLVLGQFVISVTGFRGQKYRLNTISQFALLFVIYTTFCDTFTTPEAGLSALDVIITILSGLIYNVVFN